MQTTVDCLSYWGGSGPIGSVTNLTTPPALGSGGSRSAPARYRASIFIIGLIFALRTFFALTPIEFLG
jgi:hypothetical protein